MPREITMQMILDQMLRLNLKLKRPITYFKVNNGDSKHASIGHLCFDHTIGRDGFQLRMVTSESGDETADIFGLQGRWMDKECFYTVLCVLFACADGLDNHNMERKAK